MNSKRRLTRSSNRILTGVLGGLAEYFGINKTLVRVIYVVLSIFPGRILFGLLVYLLLTVLIPEDSGTKHHTTFWGSGQQSRSRKELHDVTEEDTDKKWVADYEILGSNFNQRSVIYGISWLFKHQLLRCQSVDRVISEFCFISVRRIGKTGAASLVTTHYRGDAGVIQHRDQRGNAAADLNVNW